MDSKDGVIWIDLTDIVGWTGNYTGIQRAQMNLSERFWKHFPKGKVRFFRHDIRNYAFLEVDFNAFLKDQHIRKSLKKADSTQKESLWDLSPKQFAKKAIKGAAPLVAIKVFDVAKSQIAKKRNDAIKEKTLHYVKSPFKNDDIVMVLGGNWGSEFFLPALTLAKRQTGFRFYHVLYDLIPLARPAYTPLGVGDMFANYMRILLRHADGLIAISESTKRDAESFIQQYGIRNSPPISVFRLGDDFSAATPEMPKKLERQKDPFILCVGTFEVRKNYMLLYYVAKEAKREGISIPTIVVAGKEGWLTNDTIHLMKFDEDTKNKILHLNKVSDKELSWLYQNCLFTVFPSFYEGWGLPIAESLFYKKLCLSSNAASMPEIAGDLIDYFSPTDPVGCLNKIVHYTTMPDDLKRRELNITEHYQQTTWDNSFQSFLEVINKF